MNQNIPNVTIKLDPPREAPLRALAMVYCHGCGHMACQVVPATCAATVPCPQCEANATVELEYVE
jgi:hypothetical protein